jgi:hypothetical protein
MVKIANKLRDCAAQEYPTHAGGMSYYAKLPIAPVLIEGADTIDRLRGSLVEIIDLAEYWINQASYRNMSKTDYEVWIALGHHSNAMRKAKTVLKEEKNV